MSEKIKNIEICGVELKFAEDGVDFDKGLYVIFDDDNKQVAQDDDLDAALAVARANGARRPAIINLDMLRDDIIYVF